jgi:hypothetical protein
MSNETYFTYMVLFLIECAVAQASNRQALFISYLVLMIVASIVRFLYYVDEDE